VDFVVRRGTIEDIDRLAPLWEALRAHHATLPAMPPKRAPNRSWQYRRGQYRTWLEEGRGTLLIAERDDEAIGYAMLTTGPGAATWDVGETIVEVETLSVLAAERRQGVGTALLEAAEEFAREVGARTLAVGVAYTNSEAIRFYERHGYQSFYVTLLRTGVGEE
jgi:GNAT superfamily N-acetyltransferase